MLGPMSTRHTLALPLVLVALGAPACKQEAPPTPPPTTTVASTEDAGTATTTAAASDDASPATATAATDDAVAPTAAAAEDVAAPAPPPIRVSGLGKGEVSDADRVICGGDLFGDDHQLTALVGGKIGGRVSGPDGAVVTIGGKDLKLGKEPVGFEVDVLPLALDNSGDANDSLVADVLVPVSWRLADGTTGGGALDCAARAAIVKGLERVRKGPLRWADEGDQRYKKDLLLVVDAMGYTSLRGPYRATLYNVDLIGFERQVTRSYSPCRYDVVDSASGNRTGESVTKERSATDIVLEVYDRRTGRKVKGRTISAPAPECPDQLPMEAVSASATLADPGEFYTGLVEERPADGPDELPRPLPPIALPPEAAGPAIPETKVVDVDQVFERFMKAGYKVDDKPSHEPELDGCKQILAFATGPDDLRVTLVAHDWSPSKTPKDESTGPSAYVVGGRTAVKIDGPRAWLPQLLPLFANRSFAKPADIAAILKAAGYAIDGDLPTASETPAVADWFFSVKKEGETVFLTYVDWSAVADGKSTTEVVARSQDAFVIVTVDKDGKGPEVLAKLVGK